MSDWTFASTGYKTEKGAESKAKKFRSKGISSAKVIKKGSSFYVVALNSDFGKKK